MDLIATLEHEEIARLNKTIPAFAPGDTVIVSVNVVEGTRKRVQAFEGVVIAKRNRSLNSSFIVRKISNGEGVERTVVGLVWRSVVLWMLLVALLTLSHVLG
ncbi:hypothetical protein B566_EDAN018599 [Ephemera danica]|nr:hypothetical protein B566_EDAN018599 [Ephemera danica]